MVLQQLTDAVDLFIHGQFNQPDDWTMRQPANENEFAEIFVLREEHAIILERHMHQLFVARRRINGQSRLHIVPMPRQIGLQRT